LAEPALASEGLAREGGTMGQWRRRTLLTAQLVKFYNESMTYGLWSLRRLTVAAIRCLFATQAEDKLQIKYKIETSKNKKKNRKPGTDEHARW